MMYLAPEAILFYLRLMIYFFTCFYVTISLQFTVNSFRVVLFLLNVNHYIYQFSMDSVTCKIILIEKGGHYHNFWRNYYTSSKCLGIFRLRIVGSFPRLQIFNLHYFSFLACVMHSTIQHKIAGLFVIIGIKRNGCFYKSVLGNSRISMQISTNSKHFSKCYFYIIEVHTLKFRGGAENSLPSF